CGHPDDLACAFPSGALDRRRHLLLDFRSVRSTGTQHNLGTRIDVLDGVHQMYDALLPRDPADEQDEGYLRIDVVASEHVHVWRRPILLQVDSIVNDADTFVGDAVQRL